VNYRIICAGRSLARAEEGWVDEYIQRAKRFASVELIRVREKVGASNRLTQQQTWKNLEAAIPANSWRIVLDPNGKSLTTEQLSSLFTRIERSSRKTAAFIVGGSYGLPKEACETADTLLSLSPLTLPHRIALLVLCEQIYRVLSLRAGTPYHH
jgi:23S rRNA (pseudouridine1915-N3)-methyltransferase